jgi:hypothetical protein
MSTRRIGRVTSDERTTPCVVRRARAAVGGLVSALLLVSCGGDVSGERPEGAVSRSVSASRSVTASLPSPTRSSIVTDPPATDEDPSRSVPVPVPVPTPTRPEESQPQSSKPPAQPEPSSRPDRSESPERSPSVPDPTSAATPPVTEAAVGTESVAAAPADDSGASGSRSVAWWWWLLAAVAVAVAAGIVLYRRSSRRRAWARDLGAAEGEVGWMARELLPGLARSGSIEAASGAWAISRDRVHALEASLTELQASSHDDVGELRARFLLDAVHRTGTRVDAGLRGGDDRAFATMLLDAVSDLETATGAASTTR